MTPVSVLLELLPKTEGTSMPWTLALTRHKKDYRLVLQVRAPTPGVPVPGGKLLRTSDTGAWSQQEE